MNEEPADGASGVFDPGVLIQPVLGLIFLAAGFFTLYLLGQVVTLTCERDDANRPNCVLITTWMEWRELRVRPLPQLSTAYVDESCDEDGCTYRVMLSTNFGDLPLTSAYSSGRTEKERKAQQIIAYLRDDTQPTLTMTERQGLLLLVPLAFLVLGLTMSVPAAWNAVRKR